MNIELQIFEKSADKFDSIALEVFQWQAQFIPVYRKYLNLLGRNPAEVNSLDQIPFLPIEFFRNYSIIADGKSSAKIFRSSSTTGSIPASHHVADLALYQKSYETGFQLFYGNPKDYCILGLLPSYLERGDSSLVHMVDGLMKESAHPSNGFFLDNMAELFTTLKELEERKQKTLLIGVTFGLLDFAEQYSIKLEHCTVMETGGMKGRRKEMTRLEVHQILQKAFGTRHIQSEYGMTELLSQAYSKQDGIFHCPPWMKVTSMDLTDPFSALSPGKTGSLNIIDLANLNSCSFLATSDLGKVQADGSFEILGRVDRSMIRGCNLMAVD